MEFTAKEAGDAATLWFSSVQERSRCEGRQSEGAQIMLNPQKVGEMMKDPLTKELFDVIEDMKEAPEGCEDVAEMAAELEKDVKGVIFEGATEDIVPVDVLQLVERANMLGKLIMEYTDAQNTDNALAKKAILQKIREIGEYFSHLGEGGGFV